ncbi:hypothetical protein [Tardiphaga sp.]|jgi:hypothetical protein|uniref:hypothetical protein n=1 Tax=Tardiphaga sp. TaxID=1926292 RepID=UPI0025EC3AFD|nr:hypothetical protein [Tardiphaga sp.]
MSKFEFMTGYGNTAGTRVACLLLGLALGLPLGGCASTIADLPMVGMPAGAPARPAQAGDYLPVHDLPTSREGTAMAPTEQAKIQAELIAARDRQAVVLPAKPAGK